MKFTHTILNYCIALTLSLVSGVMAEAQKRADDATVIKAAETSLGQDMDFFVKTARSARFGDKQMTEDDSTVKIRMKGRVAGHSGSYMVTACVKDGGEKIHHVGVFLPEEQNWEGLKKDYDNLKRQLITLYGSPKETSETFIGTEPASNEGKMAALKCDGTDFTTKFTRGDTTILLSITYAKQYGAHVGMLFIDGQMAEDVAASLNDGLRRDK